MVKCHLPPRACLSSIKTGVTMHLNYIQLIIGGVSLIIIGFCVGVVIHAGEIIPYQPLIVGFIALGGAVIAYLGTLNTANAHLVVAEKNIKYQQEQKEIEDFNEKQVTALSTQILVIGIFRHLIKIWRPSKVRNDKITIEINTLVFVNKIIEPYLTKLGMKLDKLMKLDMSTATLIYDIHAILSNISLYLEDAKQESPKNPDSAALALNYIFINIGIILYGALEQNNVVLRLNKFSKSELNNEQEYISLISSFEKIRDGAKINFDQFTEKRENA